MSHTSFLSTGWSFPPDFSRAAGSVRMVADAENIRQSIFIILGTAPGERVMLPDFGCDLRRFVFHNITHALADEVKEAVTRAIERWERRIELSEVSVRSDRAEPTILMIELAFTIRQTGTRSNFIYPLSLGGE